MTDLKKHHYGHGIGPYDLDAIREFTQVGPEVRKENEILRAENRMRLAVGMDGINMTLVDYLSQAYSTGNRDSGKSNGLLEVYHVLH